MAPGKWRYEGRTVFLPPSKFEPEAHEWDEDEPWVGYYVHPEGGYESVVGCLDRLEQRLYAIKFGCAALDMKGLITIEEFLSYLDNSYLRLNVSLWVVSLDVL